MSEIRFTADHEWVRLDGEVVVVGITGHAQEALGDIVFIELPDIGRAVDQGEACAVVESVKAASDVYAPLAGTVVAHNTALTEDPALVNRDAASDGWLFKLRLSDPASFATLLDHGAYTALLEAA